MNPDLVCLECTLPFCDDTHVLCKFVELTVAPEIIERREIKRKAEIEKQGDLFAAERQRIRNKKWMRLNRNSYIEPSAEEIRGDILEILLSL